MNNIKTLIIKGNDMHFTPNFILGTAGTAYNFLNLLGCHNIKLNEAKNGYLAVSGILPNNCTVRYSEINSDDTENIHDYLKTQYNASALPELIQVALKMHLNLDLPLEQIIECRLGGDHGGFAVIIEHMNLRSVIEFTSAAYYSQRLYSSIYSNMVTQNPIDDLGSI